MAEKEKRISPALVIIPLGLGLAVATGLALAMRKPPIPPENMVLSDLTIEPVEAYVGEPVSISVVATNIGESAGSYKVTCEVV